MNRENKSQANAQVWVFLGPAPDYFRDAVRVLTKHRALLITRPVTWQRVSLAPPVPAQKTCPRKKGGPEANDEGTSSRGVWGVMNEPDEGLNRLTGLDVAWGIDLNMLLRERAQETPAAGDAGDGTAEMMGSVLKGSGGRLLRPGSEGRNSRDDGLFSRGRGERLLGVGTGRFESDSGA